MVSYKKIEIINILRKERLPLVSINLLRDLTGLTNKQSLASLVSSLIKIGILEPAERGKYLVKDNLGNDFLIANLCYKPSYVSLETALNLCGILPQFPMEISSITTRRKRTKKIGGKLYVYYHINKKFFWGFEKKEDALIALPEKALLDSLYFKSKGIKGIELEDLDLATINRNIFKEFSHKFPPTKLFSKLVKKVLSENRLI